MKLFLTLFLITFSVFVYSKEIKFCNEPYKKYNKLLNLQLENLRNKNASGFYSINGKGELDGQFKIIYNDSGYAVDLDTNYAFITNTFGQYSNGKKVGTWRYIYLFDDGIDFYEKYDIQISYKSDECTSSIYRGIIGHIMPNTTHKFTNKTLCTPLTIRNKASELWSLEFENRKKSEGL